MLLLFFLGYDRGAAGTILCGNGSACDVVPGGGGGVGLLEIVIAWMGRNACDEPLTFDDGHWNFIRTTLKRGTKSQLTNGRTDGQKGNFLGAYGSTPVVFIELLRKRFLFFNGRAMCRR